MKSLRIAWFVVSVLVIAPFTFADHLQVTLTANGSEISLYEPTPGMAFLVSQETDSIGGGGIGFSLPFVATPGFLLVNGLNCGGCLEDVIWFVNDSSQVEFFSSDPGTLAYVPNLQAVYNNLFNIAAPWNQTVSVSAGVLADGTMGATYQGGYPGNMDFVSGVNTPLQLLLEQYGEPPAGASLYGEITYTIVSNTPEPASLFLLGTIAIVLGVFARRTFRAQTPTI